MLEQKIDVKSEMRPGTKNLFKAGELLFEVTASGHDYRIYTNGRVEGFGDDVGVLNNYPRLLIGHLQRAEDRTSREGGSSPRCDDE